MTKQVTRLAGPFGLEFGAVLAHGPLLAHLVLGDLPAAQAVRAGLAYIYIYIYINETPSTE